MLNRFIDNKDNNDVDNVLKAKDIFGRCLSAHHSPQQSTALIRQKNKILDFQ